MITFGFLRGIIFHRDLYAVDRSSIELEVLILETLMIRNAFSIQNLLPHSYQLTIKVGFISQKNIDIEVNL